MNCILQYILECSGDTISRHFTVILPATAWDFFNAVMPYVLCLIITSAFSWDFYICFIFQYYECLIKVFYNFTSIFLTIKGPVSQETVLVLFHRRYPTVPILLSSKIPFVLSNCVMFMWSITIHVLCMTHESTATPFCVNKNLYIYIYNHQQGLSTMIIVHAKYNNMV